MKRFILIFGLTFLASCGQSLDTTSHSDQVGEQVDAGTNYNRIEDIQDCLNGDSEACDRAAAAGFTNIPISFNILVGDIKRITYRDMSLEYESDTIDSVTFSGDFTVTHNNRDYTVTVYTTLNDEFEAWTDVRINGIGMNNVQASFPAGTDQGWVSQFNGWNEILDSGTVEWVAIDSDELYIANVKVKAFK